MTVEREFAGFALAFTVGVLSASFISNISYHLINSFAMPSSIGFALLLGYVNREKYDSRLIWFNTILCAQVLGLFCFCNAAIMEVSSMESHGPLRSFAYNCCKSVQDCITSLPFHENDNSALINALITGERAGISKEINEAFRESGAAHLLSLSGMHLGIIYGLISKGLSILGNRPDSVIFRSIVTILSCGFYTLAVGAGESILRAFLFILINETAFILYRHRSIKQTLLVALVIQLCISPQSISSISFQLSYAAMAGIAFIYPWMKDFWPEGSKGISPFKRIWNSAAMTTACQLTTAPLAWHYFHSFPLNFLLTNLIAIPLTAVITPVSLLCIVLHSLGICPDFLMRITETLVNTLSYSLSVIAQM